MRKRSSSRKQKPSPSLPRDSLQSIFNIIATGGRSSRKSKATGRLHIQINGDDTSGPAPSPASKSLTSIGDLKDFASSQLDELKRRLDRSHSRISKDVEASRSRLHKRFKIHAQAIQQVTDEVDKEHKKISQQINETRKAMKVTFVEFVDDVQTNTSHELVWLGYLFNAWQHVFPKYCAKRPSWSFRSPLIKPSMSSATVLEFLQVS
ncbi:hypothetical protein BT93_D2183 [Corymbia citriodora subsp. variegata]|nr:hypothetical protein BT93_D2183 [Corymbia citriodora subsp. variegata]